MTIASLSRLAPAVAAAVVALAATASASGCQFFTGISACNHGERCPTGQSCHVAMGVCEPLASSAPDAGGTSEGEGEGAVGAEGEGEGALASEGEGEGSASGEGEGEGAASGEGEGEGEGAPGPACGNGVQEPGEDCDDGNRHSGDGCSATCHIDVDITEVENNDYPYSDDPDLLQISPGTVRQDGNLVAGQLRIHGAIDALTSAADCAPAASAPCSEYDGAYLDVASATVVRVEAFDGASADDCSGTSFFLGLFDNSGNFPGGNLRTAGENGVGGHCGVLTAALAPGTYWTVLTKYADDGAVPAYTEQITALSDRGGETEPNDDVAHAEIAVGQGLDVFMSGAVDAAADVDVYAVRVPPGAGVRAEVIPEDPTMDCGSFNTRLSLAGQGVDAVSRTNACAFVDGTGAAPLHRAARNDTSSDKTLYVSISVGTSAFAAPIPYKVAFTVR